MSSTHLQHAAQLLPCILVLAIEEQQQPKLQLRCAAARGSVAMLGQVVAWLLRRARAPKRVHIREMLCTALHPASQAASQADSQVMW